MPFTRSQCCRQLFELTINEKADLSAPGLARRVAPVGSHVQWSFTHSTPCSSSIMCCTTDIWQRDGNDRYHPCASICLVPVPWVSRCIVPSASFAPRCSFPDTRTSRRYPICAKQVLLFSMRYSEQRRGAVSARLCDQRILVSTRRTGKETRVLSRLIVSLRGRDWLCLHVIAGLI
jgi:hypothetical protein